MASHRCQPLTQNSIWELAFGLGSNQIRKILHHFERLWAACSGRCLRGEALPPVSAYKFMTYISSSSSSSRRPAQEQPACFQPRACFLPADRFSASATPPSYFGKSGNFTATVPLRKLQACNCFTLTSYLGLRITSSDNDFALCRSSLRMLPFQTAPTRLLIPYHYYRHTFGSVMRSWSM